MKVKICGITNVEDALFAMEAGAYAIGLVFCKKSPRYIDPECARSIVDALKGTVVTVGVFADQPTQEITKIMSLTGIDMIQLHGTEPLSIIDELPGVPVIRSLSVGDDDIEALKKYAALLIDFPKPCLGHRQNENFEETWKLAQTLTKKFTVILAGNINHDNVADAIQQVSPYAIDVCSGVELSTGIKSHSKINQLFNQINGRST